MLESQGESALLAIHINFGDKRGHVPPIIILRNNTANNWSTGDLFKMHEHVCFFVSKILKVS